VTGPRPWTALRRPAARLVLGSVGLMASATLARRDGLGGREVRVFRLVNGLPDAVYLPGWMLMQLGNLGAAPASATAAWLVGRPVLARRLLAVGSASWALSKLVKRGVGRPRPALLVAGTRTRGREQAGLGYLSGHAAVSVALGVAALPRLGGRWRPAVVAAMPAVALCRLYVGAHLPLDVVGGASLGLVVEAATALAAGSDHTEDHAEAGDGARHQAQPVPRTSRPVSDFRRRGDVRPW
jgi:membrane-associated phospholipid phosphatase